MSSTRIIQYTRSNLKVKRAAYADVEGETVCDTLRRFVAEKKRIFQAHVLSGQSKIAPSPLDCAIAVYHSDAAIAHFGYEDRRNVRMLMG